MIESLVEDILVEIIRKNRPVFASSKRCGASLSLNRSDQPRHKQSKTSNGSDQDTDRKKTQSLESEIKLLTENLKYVSKERDQLRLGLDNARMETEKLAEENHELSEANLYLRSLAEDQSRGCLEMMTSLLEIVWAVSGHTGTGGPWQGVSERQRTQFVKLCSDLILQLSSDDGSNSRQNSCEDLILRSVLGCLVNMATCQDNLSTIKETCPALISQVVSISEACDVKLLRLCLMLLCNLLGRENLYTHNDIGLSDVDSERLKKLIVRLKCGDKGRSGLKDVVEKLEKCLFGNMSEAEQ